MRGQGHYYCEDCGHAVRRSAGGCASCGTPIADLIMLDLAFSRGLASPGIGFDPLDGQFAVNIPGTGLAYEPGTGQLDISIGGFDIPV